MSSAEDVLADRGPEQLAHLALGEEVAAAHLDARPRAAGRSPSPSARSRSSAPTTRDEARRRRRSAAASSARAAKPRRRAAARACGARAAGTAAPRRPGCGQVEPPAAQRPAGGASPRAAAPRHAARLRSSSSPAVHTLPAPSVSTTSPARASLDQPLGGRAAGRPRTPTWRWPALRDRRGQRLGGDARDRLLAPPRRCRSASSTSASWKARQKSSHRRLGARVAVRLEEDQRAPGTGPARAASRASRGSRSGGGRSRRSPARRRPRRAPGSGGRRR